MSVKDRIQSIDALLPQTQCGECGYPGCLPYAEALAQGKALIDRCPPGGVAVVKALAKFLQQDPTPFLEAAQSNTRPPARALIHEADCIGCTKCISACPVDAIIGSAKTMHAILSTECTGCGLCVAPCPVDCIELIPLEKPHYDPDTARRRFQSRQVRLLRQQHEQEQSHRNRRRLAVDPDDKKQEMQARRDYIRQAMARVAEKKGQPG